MGWFAIGLVVVWLAAEHETVALIIFWVVVVTMFGVGVWTNQEKRKKRETHQRGRSP